PHSEAGTLPGTRRGAPRRTGGDAHDARAAAVGVGCGACAPGCRPRPGRARRSRPTRVDRGAARSIRALRLLRPAVAHERFLSAPLLVTAFSVPLLKERADARHWSAILVGLAGVLTMLRPSASGLVTWGALAALVSAIAYALSAIAVRVPTRTDTTASVIFWTVGLMTVFATAAAAPVWVPLERSHWPWLLALGVLAAIGQYLLTEAFRSAPPSLVAPFEYTALLWGIAIDRLVWHVLPPVRVCLGGGLVIASGLYLIWRERQHTRSELTQQSWQ